MGILILIAIAAVVAFSIYQILTSTNTLRNLLAAGKWKEANGETDRLITLTTHLAMMGKFINYECPRLDYQELNYIPCSILHTIDQLWVQYSNGHFGFSVQLSILEECKKNNWKKQEIMSKKKSREEYVSVYSGAKTFVKDWTPQLNYELGEAVELVMLWEKVGWTVKGFCDDEPDSFYFYTRLHSISDFNYSLMTPKGHLPIFCNRNFQGADFYTLGILQQLKKCN